MIKETTRKLNLISYVPQRGKPKDTEKPPMLSLNTKFGNLVFGAKAIRALDMEGKWMKLFYEPTRRIIAWRLTDKLENEEIQSKEYRLVKPNPKSGVLIVSIQGILKSFVNVKENFTYKCEIKRYREMSDLMNRGEIFHFVQLTNVEDTNEKDDD